MMKIIEQKRDDWKIKVKDVLIPILLVLACLCVPILFIVVAVLMSDPDWGAFVCFAMIFFVWAVTALVLYIREKKCFKLIKSLIAEVFYSFLLFSCICGNDNDFSNWKVWLFFAVLSLILWFYNIFKLRFEWKFEKEKKRYNKRWVRIILVVVAGLLLWLLASFFTVHCATHTWFFCNLFTKIMSNIDY